MLEEKDYLYDDYKDDFVSFNDMSENIKKNIDEAKEFNNEPKEEIKPLEELIKLL